MTKTIWKFPLEAANYQEIDMPKGAKILSVAEQYGNFVLYALVNPNAEKAKRAVWILGTGHPAEGFVQTRNFVGTVKLLDGQLMFHVFANPAN